MKEPKFYIDEDGKGFFECPNCRKQVKVDPYEFQGLFNGVKVKCSCDYEFRVFLGLREGRRKQSFLRGYYAKLPQGKEKGRIRVRDVSIKGIRFTTWNVHDLKVGDKILVQFVLEDRWDSEIVRPAMVRWVTDMTIGCQFTDCRDRDANLGFYVMDLPQHLTDNALNSKEILEEPESF